MLFNYIIPLPYYTAVFYNVLLFVILFTAFKLFVKDNILQSSIRKERVSFILFVIVSLYMGLRPISGYYFVDMGVYNSYFEYYAGGGEIIIRKDFLWHVFMKFCSGLISAHQFFLLCAFLYTLPLYIATKKWIAINHYYLLIMLIASFSFWGAGTNGIRNGIATSLFILALSLSNKKYLKAGIMLLAFFIHGSVIIPIAAFILTLFYKNTKYYLYGWVICIILSLVLGEVFENAFMYLGYSDERTTYLTDSRFSDQFSSTGFRWDFLLYSAFAVFLGYYFIFKKKFKDKVYTQLFNIYVIANAFWILIIRVNFSNRFAYLSWFLMAVIIFYPLLKQRFLMNQQKILAFLMLTYFGFTYIMTL